jgi:hypothetical protein
MADPVIAAQASQDQDDFNISDQCQDRAPRRLPEVNLAPEGGRDVGWRPAAKQCAPGIPPTVILAVT